MKMVTMPSRITNIARESYRWDAPGPYPAPPGTPEDCSIRYSQDLISSSNNGNQIRSGKLRKGKKDIGGNFLVVRRFYDEYSSLGTEPRHFNSTGGTSATSPGRPHYWSPQSARFSRVTNASFPPSNPSSGSVMNQLGTKAIAKLAPTKPNANLSTFLGELREGLPHAILLRNTGRARAQRALNAGDEYLNVEFGWKPLVRDVRKFLDSYRRSEEILDEYFANANKVIRRRYDFPTQHTVSVEDLGNNLAVPTLATSCYGSSAAGRLFRTVTNTRKQWCVVTFMYGLPPRNSVEGRKAAMNKLYGSNLTPETLWNIGPWSWAADWIGNGGDLATNITLLNDNLAMPYCYVMETSSTKVEYALEGYGNQYRSYPGKHYFRQSFETVTKQRVQGTPYGFGLSWDGFNATQLGILAALGISRY
jgi:hypothetical protein